MNTLVDVKNHIFTIYPEAIDVTHCFLSPYWNCEPEPWTLFRGLTAEMCSILLFTLRWAPPWPRPLMVWKCFYFIWLSGSGRVWHAEQKEDELCGSQGRTMSRFFSLQEIAFAIYFLSSPVYQWDVPHLEAGRRLRCISMCVWRVCAFGTATGFTD